jgi:hypothetical protein
MKKVVCFVEKISLFRIVRLLGSDHVPMGVNKLGQKTLGFTFGENGKGGCHTIRLYYRGCLGQHAPENFGNFCTLVSCSDPEFMEKIKALFPQNEEFEAPNFY